MKVDVEKEGDHEDSFISMMISLHDRMIDEVIYSLNAKNRRKKMKKHELTPELKLHFQKMFGIMEFVQKCADDSDDMPEVQATFQSIHDQMAAILKKEETK